MGSLGIVSAVVTVFILFTILLAILLSYLKSLKYEVQNEWEVLLEFLRHRADLIPLWIENGRKKGSTAPVDFISQLIAMRAKSWSIVDCNGEKVSTELELSSKIRELQDTEDNNPSLQKDNLYLTLKREFKELASRIELAQEKYNQKVRQYNKISALFFLKPFLKFLKLEKFSIFEFEG